MAHPTLQAVQPVPTGGKRPEEAFRQLYDIVVRLRGPGGCPWDREQNPSSLRGCLIEETFECIEAIDSKDSAHVCEELGDIFLAVTMIAYMHEEQGAFSLADVFTTISEKLVRRHPHVFAETVVRDSSEVMDNWAKIKVEQEGRKPKDSILDSVSGGLPPLDRAYKLQKKAAKAGFDWPNIEGVADKIREELAEVLEAAKGGEASEKIEEELGDLLFSAVNLCRYLKAEPSTALRRTNSKFVERFRRVEKKMKETGQEMRQENLGLMDRYWNEAKQ
ncbi:MAG: nucleoside triphosphate pyrophosphohydrolase [Treponema sp.]|jgi:tetrapyrrole methylase family protein/MazG family protein|nr:nucleoside triphosphate pyrophosphohydrolase [Treponema sp.]